MDTIASLPLQSCHRTPRAVKSHCLAAHPFPDPWKMRITLLILRIVFSRVSCGGRIPDGLVCVTSLTD